MLDQPMRKPKRHVIRRLEREAVTLLRQVFRSQKTALNHVPDELLEPRHALDLVAGGPSCVAASAQTT
jgi:hypothetical protein